ncbi:MAG: tetratricopeptide repeat protein [Candidatus Protochlamydia sp.]|nr:tetratricopeptide repeat protein [Candidatus Protochlamydia sp.]
MNINTIGSYSNYKFNYNSENKENTVHSKNRVKINVDKPINVKNKYYNHKNLFIITTSAENLRKQGKFLESYYVFQKALTLPGSRQNIFTLSTYGETLRGLGLLQEAAQVFEEALKIPGSHKVLFTVGKYAQTLFFQGKFKEADRYFLQAKEIPGGEKSYELISRHALNLFLQNKYLEADFEFRKTFKLFSIAAKDASVMYCYAKNLYSLGAIHAAKQVFLNTLKLPNGNRGNVTMLGYVQSMQDIKEIQSTYNECQNALKLNIDKTSYLKIHMLAEMLLRQQICIQTKILGKNFKNDSKNTHAAKLNINALIKEKKEAEMINLFFKITSF